VFCNSANAQTCPTIEFAELQTYSVKELKKQFCTIQSNVDFQSKLLVSGASSDSVFREIEKCTEQARRVQRILKTKGSEQKGSECSK
jgi:hypothetical protein